MTSDPPDVQPPLVDIVLATNRCSPYLADTLGSIYAQVGVAWHLIVVDDGVPDPDLLRDLLPDSSTVTLVRHPPGGVSRARNAGLRRARGELVSFVDDDDVWEPDRLATLVETFGDDPSCVGSYSGAVYIGERGELLGSGWPGTPGSRDELLRGEVPLPRLPTLLFRRRAVTSAGGFDVAYRVAEDNDLILRVLQRGELIGVDRPLVRYRRHAANTSTSGTLEARMNSYQILRHQTDRARAEGRSQDALALESNLRRLQPGWAAEALRGLRSAVRDRDRVLMARELRWLLLVQPRAATSRLAVLIHDRGHSQVKAGAPR